MANFSRLKVWTTDEDLFTADLNAEFDNLLSNFDPAGMDDYSTSVAQMQIQTDPGSQGSESQPTSLAGELERIRFVLDRVIGLTYWYDAPSVSLEEANTLLNQVSTLPPNRIVSGTVRSANSNQASFLNPDGSTDEVDLLATTTNFVYRVDGTQYTISADQTLDNLIAAPSTNNTALVDDTSLSGQESSKLIGELGTSLTIDTVGSEITDRIGEYAGFVINNGVDDEYFIAYVESATSLSQIRRGYFFTGQDTPVERITISNNDTITLLNLQWIYARTDLLLEAGSRNPVYSADEPTTPSTGDRWFDQVNQTWKLFNGATFVSADATLIGLTLTDSSDNTVAARAFDFFDLYDSHYQMKLDLDSTTQVSGREFGNSISVKGRLISWDYSVPIWNISTDLDSGISEGSSTEYYLYVTDTGDTVISDIAPYDRKRDQKGYYHPHNPWRLAGRAFNDGSSDLVSANDLTSKTPWETFTPTGAWTTNTTYTGQWQRDGDSINIRYALALAGAPTAATLTLNPPESLTVDTDKILNGDRAGQAHYFDNGVGHGQLFVRHVSGTIVVMAVSEVTATHPITWASGDELKAQIDEIPINEYKWFE